jgi:hypothetical protein
MQSHGTWQAGAAAKNRPDKVAKEASVEAEEVMPEQKVNARKAEDSGISRSFAGPRAAGSRDGKVENADYDAWSIRVYKCELPKWICRIKNGA